MVLLRGNALVYGEADCVALPSCCRCAIHYAHSLGTTFFIDGFNIDTPLEFVFDGVEGGLQEINVVLVANNHEFTVGSHEIFANAANTYQCSK